MGLDGRTADRLAAETRFGDIRWVVETGSTNADLQALAERGGAEGMVLVADHQTAGRGRLDRTWDAPPGDGLLVSVLLRPEGLAPERRSLVSSAVALAACRACATVAGVEPAIKWPNDLLSAQGAKLAGILAVAAGGAVVVGMGLNVRSGPPGSAWLEDLAGRPVSRELLLAEWLVHLDALVGEWDEVAQRYAASCATVGRRVAVTLSDGSILEAEAEAVDAAGQLVVRDDDGRVLALAVGDVVHLR